MQEQGRKLSSAKTSQTDTNDDIPDRAWETVEQHDLGNRADSPLSAVTVMLSDAAHKLTEAARRTFDEQAVSAETLKSVTACAAMVAYANANS